MIKRSAITSVLVLALHAGCTRDAGGPRKKVRSVTTLTLEESTPSAGGLSPGVVTPYREIPLPFEVAGRIVSLVDVGEEVGSEQVSAEGRVLRAGSILAQLDPAPFKRALSRAEQKLVAAQLHLKAQQVQLDTVLPARIASAESQARAAALNTTFAEENVAALESAVDLAQTTFERNEQLLPSGAVSDIAVRQSATALQAERSSLAQARTLVAARKREHEAALASVAELQGGLRLQEASNEALSAEIRQLENVVADARSNLEDCVLRAPFSGRVTQLHVGEGSFVQPGTPIVTLTMMSPIQVEITVSAATESQLVLGTDAKIYPMRRGAVDTSRAIGGTLYRKRGVADSRTRTFAVGVIAPNDRLKGRREAAGVPTVPFLLPVFDNPLRISGGEGLYTVAEAVNAGGPEAWVLRVRGLVEGARTAEALRGKLEVERLRVTLGPGTFKSASYSIVKLADSDALKRGDLLVPMPSPAHAQGIVVDDSRWLLRPGDVVQVALDGGAMPKGFYVPVQAVREANGKTWLMVVKGGNEAREVVVHVEDSVGELRRIVSPDLKAGDLVVEKGVHYLQDGDRVKQVRRK